MQGTATMECRAVSNALVNLAQMPSRKRLKGAGADIASAIELFK